MDEDGAHERAEHTPLWDPHAHCPGAWHPVTNSDFLGLSVRKCNTWLQRVAGYHLCEGSSFSASLPEITLLNAEL